MPAKTSNTSYFDATQPSPSSESPANTEQDQQRLCEIAARIEQLRAELIERIAARGKDQAGILQQSLERDVELGELARRLRQLDRMGPYACLGFMELAETGERLYVGRLGLSDEHGKQLMIDWRAPAAEPFFAATHEKNYGLAIRRRYRWRRQRISDYWDEVFDSSQLASHARLDDHSSFLASLGSKRSPKMQDVLSTIQSDQDAIIRSGSQGALVVDGGPGTGKTVVALHRAAYLLYADPRLRSQGGRILVVSPHEAYSAYVSDILPNLGEDEVLISTLSNIVSNYDGVLVEPDQEVHRIKSSLAMLDTIKRAVLVFEEPPSADVLIDLAEAQATVTSHLWRDAAAMIDHDTPHNEARTQLREALIDQLLPQVASADDDEPLLRAELARSTALNGLLAEHWPVLDPLNLLKALYSTPALLRYSGRELGSEEIAKLLANPAAGAWTASDIPLIDLARFLIGDPHSESKHLDEQSRIAAKRKRWKNVIDDLMASADDKEDLSSQLMHQDLQEQLLAQGLESNVASGGYSGPFSHVIIDEAQDLTDAQWAMVQRRCPSGSLTIVGDRAQAVDGFRMTWEQRLAQVGIRDIIVSPLHVNYRGTAQIMEAAAEQILAHMPEANVPRSLRLDGAPVKYARLTELGTILDHWLAENAQGTAAVIGAPNFRAPSRVSVLSPENAKGLEFDLVLVCQPQSFGTGLGGAVRRYVAMTRATAQLVVLTEQ
ncbi:RNA polymerase recycling motor ATPase HelR [Glutamicibacter halophytocola]|uniref:RNA polymerase recycling motor ATPase HelR n=1 Tax=Glutamicibacter halophytocola TaxID=1933880 RepID=UPI0015C57B40|nr:RNA polymerase recycling motor ATPase HelR [Glutamicibacter halophytocola]NQD40955.1 UvrD-helicase domain-containing protein [Glutamicibacter halophytocola]